MGYKRAATEEVTFKLRVGYRLESNHKDTRSMLDGWVAQSKIGEDSGQIVGHLISPYLNLIFEIGR